ncbi:MAG TPA: AAA family ATPase, partial [Bacteroidetes bacterium]|nr:AAA family ATPase [Bacteroidota bacterium]
LKIIFQLLEKEPLSNPGFHYKGKITGLLGNLTAFQKGKRHLVKDLNRMWLPQNVERLKKADLSELHYEDREMRELMDIIEYQISTCQPSSIVLLDLHTTSAGGGIFTIATDNPESIRIAMELHAPVITGMLNGISGTTLHFFTKKNIRLLVPNLPPHVPVTAVAFEAGQHDDPLSVNRCIAAIINCMRSVGSVRAEDVENRHDRILQEYSKDLPKIAKLLKVHHIEPRDEFQMLPGFKNFQPVKRGHLLARDRHGNIYAPEDGLLLMPLYQPQGSDGFFLIKEINTATPSPNGLPGSIIDPGQKKNKKGKKGGVNNFNFNYQSTTMTDDHLNPGLPSEKHEPNGPTPPPPPKQPPVQEEQTETPLPPNAPPAWAQNRLDLSPLSTAVANVKNELRKVIIGQEKMTDLLIAAILCNGHVLIEGVPGIAKTLTARILAQTLAAGFSRIQFTPDLMPSDVVGTTVFNMKTSEFSFNAGPIFSNIILIDEINRAPAKTQAALFEVMEEYQVTVDGTTHPMANPFFVIATQNPIEQEGTYKLPEAQLDRFLFKINVDYPRLEEEKAILRRFRTDFNQSVKNDVQPVFSPRGIAECRSLTEQVQIREELLDYIAGLVHHTRNHPDLFLGASPRASLAIMKAAKATAAMNGRDFVTPDDIQSVAFPVLNHRIILTPEREMEGFDTKDVIEDILKKLEIPR